MRFRDLSGLRAPEDKGPQLTRSSAGLFVLAVAAAGCGSGSGSRTTDPPVLVPWHKIGDIGLGVPKERVLREYGKEPELGYQLHGGKVQVAFDRGRVTSIWFS